MSFGPMTPSPAEVTRIVREALREDIGRGDLTSLLTVDPSTRARGEFIAKAEGVMAGGYVAAECFRQADETASFEALVADGQSFSHRDVLARVEGTARGLLGAERVSLNFVQRLCGIATLTRRFVEAVEGTGVKIVDTRKTTPGLRALEKAAVVAGGGSNHRFALYDGILIKDNHIRLAGGVSEAISRAGAGAPVTSKIEVETATLDEVREALDAGADIIMLDNMDLDTMREAVGMIGGQALVEASGGMTTETVPAVAEVGVDLISVGRLTHSAPAIDMSLELEALG